MNPLQWTQAVHAACIEATPGPGVVIDTFAFWSKIQDENDTAGMQMAAAALAELTASDLGVVIVHHHGKNAEARENGNASRGSTSLPAVWTSSWTCSARNPLGTTRCHPMNGRSGASAGTRKSRRSSGRP